MARSTGVILATGGITLANGVLLNGKPFDVRVPVATGVAAMLAAGAERLSPDLVVGVAWIALVTSLIVRTRSDTPSPAESLVRVLKL